jgi:hypothetical protein
MSQKTVSSIEGETASPHSAVWGRRCNGDSRGSSKLMMIMDSITESGKVPGEGATVMRQSGAQPHRASVLLPCRKRRSGYYQVPRGTKQAAW